METNVQIELATLMGQAKGEVNGVTFNGHERNKIEVKDDNNIVLVNNKLVKMTKKEIEEKDLKKYTIISNKKLNALVITSLFIKQAAEEAREEGEFIIREVSEETDEPSDNNSENATEEKIDDAEKTETDGKTEDNTEKKPKSNDLNDLLASSLESVFKFEHVITYDKTNFAA